MSLFTPSGTVIVAFDNGVVRTWNMLIRSEFKKLGKSPQDLADISYLQFDLQDDFDMNNPDRDIDYEHEVIKHDRCEAVFAVDSSSSSEYISYCSGQKYLFVRAFKEHDIRIKISLMGFPTCLRLDDFGKLARDAGMEGG